jgi:kynurenine formamidase
MALADRKPPTAEEYVAYRSTFCNWQRWGDKSELGTLNFISPEARIYAASLVGSGRTVSLMRPISTHSSPANPYPPLHLVPTPHSRGHGDFLGVFLHSFIETHIDALCHASTPDGRIWNGHTAGPFGISAERHGTVDYFGDGIVTRGVLYDVPRHRGTAYVTPGSPVHGWELADIAKAQNVQPRAGDAVIIRCGYEEYWEAEGTEPRFASVTGVHASAAEFLYETEAALVAWDFQDAPTSDQKLPNPLGDSSPVALHVHQILLAYMGMPIVDNVRLTSLADACVEIDRWEFQLVVAPLIIPGATGSPVNPIAIL